MNVWVLEGILFGSAFAALGVGMCIGFRHRLAVNFMRRFGIHIYPEAISIATLIMDHPDQWSADEYRMSHPIVGRIWTANEAYGIKIETPMGDWKPNAYERLIIRDAVDWRLNQYIRNRIALALRENGRLPPGATRLT